jgi:hypothetical protein
MCLSRAVLHAWAPRTNSSCTCSVLQRTGKRRRHQPPSTHPTSTSTTHPAQEHLAVQLPVEGLVAALSEAAARGCAHNGVCRGQRQAQHRAHGDHKRGGRLHAEAAGGRDVRALDAQHAHDVVACGRARGVGCVCACGSVVSAYQPGATGRRLQPCARAKAHAACNARAHQHTHRRWPGRRRCPWRPAPAPRGTPQSWRQARRASRRRGTQRQRGLRGIGCRDRGERVRSGRIILWPGRLACACNLCAAVQDIDTTTCRQPRTHRWRWTCRWRRAQRTWRTH